MSEEAGEYVIVVSGLPRSGTSMMMRMLEAGGVDILTDGIRAADEDNPKGYYEVELVKTLRQQIDKFWLEEAKGKAVKVISSLLDTLPQAYTYKVIFMNRNIEEVIASQNKMRLRRGDNSESADEDMARLFRKHLEKVKDWIARQSNFKLIDVDYREVLESPLHHAERIKTFLGKEIDVEKMSGVVDGNLYRNRR
ncbi:MAG: sulfotransferase [Pyrinomonadaceae bacterium]|nr:sulfotransferase [Pyrinomonadaceae bacterium]